MFVAIPVWQGRVSPVFDVAGQLLVVEIRDAEEVGRTPEVLSGLSCEGRLQRLAEKRITTLVCGAISQPLQVQLVGRGIEVISGICGNIDEVLDGFRTGRLREERFAMPGYERLPAGARGPSKCAPEVAARTPHAPREAAR